MNEQVSRIKQITTESPMHIVVVADDSGSMETEHEGKRAADHATMAIQDWVAELQLQTTGLKPWFKLSLIHFGSTCEIDAEAMNINDVDLSEFQLDATSGSTRMDTALSAAADVLARTASKPDDCPPFVFLFTDGYPDDGTRDATIAAAARLKSLPLPCGNPRVVTIGFGAVDVDLLQRLATNADFFKPIVTARDLVRMLPKMGTPTKAKGGGGGVPTVGSFEQQIADYRPRDR